MLIQMRDVCKNPPGRKKHLSAHELIDFPTNPANQAIPITEWGKKDNFRFRLFTITLLNLC